MVGFVKRKRMRIQVEMPEAHNKEGRGALLDLTF